VTPSFVIAGLAFGIWLYLILFRGGFWLARERDDQGDPALQPGSDWPSVAVVIPARNEAEMLPLSLGSLLAQDYAGKLSIVIVDDGSSDGTAEVASAMSAKATRDVTVIHGKPPPPGWTGKVWAMQQGVTHAEAAKDAPDYLLLTDADIEYAPSAIARLVARATASRTVLTSLMVKLNCASLPERALIPAFVFFFQMLYPFAWVNRTGTKTAAAAGGSMLVQHRALARAGGIARISSALIDDCALANLMKREGPIWLGLSRDVRSLRSYPRLGDLRLMIARSAYAQLRYSPLLLAVTISGMALTFLAPPVLATFGGYPANAVAAGAWALMALAYLPILSFYRLPLLWAPALPLIALAYLTFTLDSACQHWRGRGGLWKGRSQASLAKR
jgi:hopene-associated glycosyltransferase HpnB